MPKISAAVAIAPHSPLEPMELALAEPRGTEILVRTKASGICHTDLIIRDSDFGAPLPAVLGHEGAGIVEAVGDAVRDISPGDHVLLTQASCGHCKTCRHAHPMNCENFARYNISGKRANGEEPFDGRISGGVGGQSSFATHMLAYDTNAVILPRDYPLEWAAALSCGVTTGASSVLRVMNPPAGSTFVVIGAGAVGLGALMAAHVAGCSTIVAVDLLADRRNLALELGATHVLDGADADLAAAILEITRGGADFLVDAVGLPGTTAGAVQALRPGGHAILLGAAGVGQSAPIDIMALLFNRKIQGATLGDQVPQTTIPTLINLQQQGRFPFEKLLSFYPFSEINAAIDDMEAGRVVKPVLLFD